MLDTSRADQGPLTLFRDAEFVALALVKFTSGVSFATILIALALYVDLFDASGLVAGLFGTVYAITRTILTLPIGRYIDLGNTKKYVLIGLGVSLAVFVGFLFVESAEDVLILRAVQGAGSITLGIATTTAVGEIAPDENQGLWIGTQNQVGAVSSLLGDIVGGALLFLLGFRPTYVVLIAVTIVAILATAAFVQNTSASEQTDPSGVLGPFRKLFNQHPLQALIMYRVGFSFGKTAVKLFLPIYIRTQFDGGALTIGIILAGGKLIKSTAQGYLGNLGDRFGYWPPFIGVATLLSVISVLLMAFASRFTGVLFSGITLFDIGIIVKKPYLVLFLAFAILGLADSFRIPASQTMFIQGGQRINAIASGISMRRFSWQAGAILGPLVFGGVLDLVSYELAFLITAGIMVISGGVFYYKLATAKR